MTLYQRAKGKGRTILCDRAKMITVPFYIVLIPAGVEGKIAVRKEGSE